MQSGKTGRLNNLRKLEVRRFHGSMTIFGILLLDGFEVDDGEMGYAKDYKFVCHLTRNLNTLCKLLKCNPIYLDN